eukprot:15035572-Ditylum_brightwellii.AAC.1
MNIGNSNKPLHQEVEVIPLKELHPRQTGNLNTITLETAVGSERAKMIVGLDISQQGMNSMQITEIATEEEQNEMAKYASLSGFC